MTYQYPTEGAEKKLRIRVIVLVLALICGKLYGYVQFESAKELMEMDSAKSILILAGARQVEALVRIAVFSYLAYLILPFCLVAIKQGRWPPENRPVWVKLRVLGGSRARVIASICIFVCILTIIVPAYSLYTYRKLASAIETKPLSKERAELYEAERQKIREQFYNYKPE